MCSHGPRRRIREFGTLKALGWKSRRVVGQVMGESIAIGIVGGVVGVALGFAGAQLVDHFSRNLSASLGGATGTATPAVPSGSAAVRAPPPAALPARAATTGNLDEDTRDEIIGLLEKLWQDNSLTMVTVTHDRSVARRAQCLGTMRNGQLTVKQGAGKPAVVKEPAANRLASDRPARSQLPGTEWPGRSP